MKVAIDGPAGAGKSTIAKRVAKELGYIYVDTGAMYRAMALYLLRKGISADDQGGIESACADADISITFREGQQRVLLNGEDVTSSLRSESVGNMASASSANGAVRKKLVELQKRLAAETSVVMDGRDIGTVVLPDAEVKIFLTASSEVRAERRYKELLEKSENEKSLTPAALPSPETIKRDIEERDYRDMHREISPLQQAQDAVLLDSSLMSIHEVTDKILELCRRKI